MRTTLSVLALPLFALALAEPAAAQTVGSSMKPKILKPEADQKAKVLPPAAVPGARARADSVAPADKGINDMPPTEALFDSINRGDIGSAKDAIGRGADLDATNLLGLTPLELSVDLARNDISFLLLSMRGAGSSRSAGMQPGADAPVLTPAQRRQAERQAAAQARAEAASQRRAASATREAVPAPAQTPALFAGNGGAPVPSAGFLGFDSRR